MRRVSEPAPSRRPTRIRPIDRAATGLKAIAEAFERYTGATVRRDAYGACMGELEEALVGLSVALRPGLGRRTVPAANDIEALLR
jgi:hypothetical protein